jgi:hypothetical protein
MSEQDTQQQDQYHVTVVPDTGEVVVETYDDVAELVSRLVALSHQSVTVSIFQGRRLFTTKGSQRYLKIDEKYHPLFEEVVPEALELDSEGYLGDARLPMIGVGYASTEKAAEEEDAPAEEYDEDEYPEED